MVRIGTSGGLQPHVPIGTFVISEKSIGFDGVLNFYAGRNEVCDLEFEKAFCDFVEWNSLWAAPYVIDADKELVEQIGKGEMVKGVTISANGFYGPQGTELRVPLADKNLNKKIEAFKYKDGHVITITRWKALLLPGYPSLWDIKP